MQLHKLKIAYLVLFISFLLLPHMAKATFPWPYTWGAQGLKPYTDCGPSGGFVNGLCLTAQIDCDSDRDLYGAPSAVLTLGTVTSGAGVVRFRWTCDFFKFIAHHEPVEAFCPTGYVVNVFTSRGCVPEPYPKNFGKGCAVPTPKSTAGNPITICSGNKYQEKTDYQGAGTHHLDFTRTYNSMASWSGKLGIGWRHTFERSLLATGTSGWGAIRPDGQQINFSKSGGVWNPVDSDTVLTLAASGTNFLLTDENNNVETYDSTGKLLSIVDRDGYTQTLTYTTGNLTSITDSLGRTITFTYNTDGLIDTVTDPDSNVYTYAYTAAYPGTSATVKKLLSVTYPDSTPSPTDNPVITYLYANTDYPTYLTGITDERGNNYATWAYDSDGQATSSQHAGGADLTTITYNGDGTKTVTLPLTGQVKYTFSIIKNAPKVTREDRLAVGTIPAANRQYTYDTNGFLATMLDWNGNSTHYTFNSRGLETSRTEAFGTAQARTIGTTWSTTFRLPTQITRTGLTTGFTYDTSGNMLTRTQTDTQTQSIPYSTNGATRTWTYTYDALGDVLTEDGPRTDLSDVTTYTYGTTNKNLLTVTDALSHVTTITSYNNRGLPLSITDPNGVVTDLTYDAMGRLKSRTVNASGGNAVTSYDYDLAGLLTKITLPDSSVLNYEYDTAQRLNAVQNDLGERIEYTLDAAGNITQENVKAVGGGIRRKQSREFDEISRLTKVIGATTPEATAYAYDANGNRTSVTDARSNAAAMAFDALNRLITITDPLTHSATTGYDSRDNVTSQQDFKTFTTNYVYDGFNRVIQAASPDSGTTVFTLDKAGNRTSETDARSVVTNRTFDALNRVLTETFPASTSENIAYTYDSTTGGNFGIGRLTSFTDESGSTALKYDERGNVIEMVNVIGSNTYTTDYEYDLVDRLTYIAYPSGRRVKYTYDSHGNLTTVETKPALIGLYTTIASSIVHEPFGPIKSLTYGNGLTLANTFDQNYWLTGILTQDGSTHIQDLTNTFDNAGNITAITDNLDATRNQSFTLDALNRISQGIGPYGTIDYTYDNNSNRLTRVKGGVTQTSTISSTSNKLTSINDGTNTRSFTYTNAGNTATDDRATDPDVALTYGGRNRLESVTVGGSTAGTYKINAWGQRASKVAGGNTTQFVYGLNGNILAEADGSGTLIRENIWLEGQPLVQVDASGNLAYVHTDHLGTPQKMTDGTEAVIWDRQQEPFGEQYALTATATNNLRFPGQYLDAEDALNYNLLRDYDTTLGRYIQFDPTGQLGGPNPYSYVGANPIIYTDPLGLDWVYQQSTGQISYIDAKGRVTKIGTGYSGQNLGLNNPAYQNVSGTDKDSNGGPLPQGTYDIGRGYNGPLGRPTMNLMPQEGTETFGRTLFRIHADNSEHNYSASEGCIVTGPSVRRTINNSNDRILQVIP